MRTNLNFDKKRSSQDVNYQGCLTNLAFAVHIEEPKEVLSMSGITKDVGLDEINLSPCLTNYNKLSPSSAHPNCVTHVPNSQEMRFFASDPHFQPDEFALYTLQGVEVTKALYTIKSEKKDDSRWRRITGKDI